MEHPALEEAFQRTREFLDGIGARRVGARAASSELRARLGVALPQIGTSEVSVIRDLAAAVEPGLVASGSPRYFGFVTGGTLPVALAADWLTAAWDQNAAMYVQSPAAAVTEEIVARWLLELLHLPASASVGLVTGCQMANFTGLAAARGALIRRLGLDPDEVGLSGAPPLTVVVGREAHATIFSALRMLGIGSRQIRVADSDAEGRMLPSALAAMLRTCEGPTIVCAQVGNVNSGAADPIAAIADQTAARGAWLHVDGAFGLWAAASPRLAHLVEGLERADSWATDAHKWLNVPYDCGIAIVRDPAAHRHAVANNSAAYLVSGGDDRRDGQDWAPESSRRVRAFPLYAAIRALGQAGISDLVERCCALARQLGDRLASLPGATVLNQIVLNQVVVTFERQPGSARGVTADVLRLLQEGGECWAGPTVWRGVPAVRFSISSWRTTAADIDRTADAVAAALMAVRIDTSGAEASEAPGSKRSRLGYDISIDGAAIDVDAVYAYLTRSYWAEGIPKDLVAKAIAASVCVGAFHDGAQVGFARVVTDRATFAYLCDVYVLEEHRGRGLGKRMVETVAAHPELRGLRRFVLATRDAHGLYERFGFAPLAHPEMFMEINRPGLYLMGKAGAPGTW